MAIATGTALALGAAATVGSTIYSSNAAKKTGQAAGSMTYERVNLDELQQQARLAAIENATTSMALEKKLMPDVARARETLSKQVADELSLGGQISPDIARQVATQATTKATTAGLEGGAGPITAATLGLTAMDLQNQRQQKAASLLAQNPLPEAGLSPGSLASAAVADINSANQFQVSKTAAQQNAALARANAISSGIGNLAGLVMGAAGGKG